MLAAKFTNFKLQKIKKAGGKAGLSFKHFMKVTLMSTRYAAVIHQVLPNGSLTPPERPYD